MHRRFATTTSRHRIDLEGSWDLCLDPGDEGMEEGWYASFPASHRESWVPGVWNTHLAYLNYEGVAWYRRRLTLGPCAAALLSFGAVTHQAHVWLDGELLGEHYGGFLPFSFLVSQPEPGQHELVVRVDNTHDLESTIPSANLDWFRYGGITRPVWAEELAGPGHVASLRLTPSVAGSQGLLRVRAELQNLGDAPIHDQWTLWVEDRLLRSGHVRLEPGCCEVLLFSTDVPDVAFWSPDDPRLYTVRLAFAGDDLIERTGFRELRIEGRQVLLNGAPLRIAGVNRHEDHPDWGFSLPPQIMLRDLEVLADLGCNSIRGAHYPNDPRFLDLCDERGILFIEEIPLWGLRSEQMALDTILARAPAMMWATIERDINHPCIWAWSVLNECATDTAVGRALVERLVETVREADDTRPVTFASNRNLDDICFDLVDVACVNAYHGWYTHDITWPEFLEQMRAKVGDKPLVVSEFGAGGIYGWHALEEGVMWSEEHQSRLVSDCVRLFVAREDLLGFYIWQFSDTRTDAAQRALGRPRGYNNKGLLDEHRRPKLAYHAVRDLLRG